VTRASKFVIFFTKAKIHPNLTEPVAGGVLQLALVTGGHFRKIKKRNIRALRE